MGIKEAIQNIGNKSKERRELLNQMAEKMRLQKLAEDRQKSSNQRELERLMNEEREKSIKEQLKEMRKRRQNDIRFNHNPLDTPNITNHAKWEVLKEKNQFSNNKSTLFHGDGNIMKNNKNLLKNNRRLFGL